MNKIGLVFLFLLLVEGVWAQNIDAEAFESLKKEAEFDINRRSDFKNQVKKSQIFDRERDKGKVFYLEEKERWEYLREQGVPEQRRLRKQVRAMDENSPEYRQDQKEKQKREQQQEEFRKNYVRIRNQFSKKIQSSKVVSEEEEHGLTRSASGDRYSVEKRLKDKWIVNGKTASEVLNGEKTSGVSASSSGRGSSKPSYTPPENNYVPPAPDYSAYPTDSFEELPPPPSMPYEGEYMEDGFLNPDMNNSGEFGFPPPPPAMNEGGWDF